jgi:hypothetical protein
LPSLEGSNLHAYKTRPRRSKRYVQTTPEVCDSVGLRSGRRDAQRRFAPRPRLFCAMGLVRVYLPPALAPRRGDVAVRIHTAGARLENPQPGSPFNRSWFPASTGGPGQASPDWAGALVGVEA